MANLRLVLHWWLFLCILQFFIYGAVITILYFIPIKRKLYLYVAILGSAMLGIVFKQLNFMDFF